MDPHAGTTASENAVFSNQSSVSTMLIKDCRFGSNNFHTRRAVMGIACPAITWTRAGAEPVVFKVVQCLGVVSAKPFTKGSIALCLVEFSICKVKQQH